MVNRMVLAALAFTAGLSSAAVAASSDDRTGFTAIAAQDWAGAERALLAEMRIHPRRPELMLNLAAVYARTGREDAARALYAAVLERPEVAMDLPTGEVRSSHSLAETGLARSPAALASAR